MDEKTKELYARRQAEALREDDAKLRRLEAQVRGDQAKEQVEEVSGLRALHDRISDQVKKFQTQAAADSDQMKSDIEDSWSGFKARLEIVHGKILAVDDARLARLNARLDSINAGIDALDARGQQGIAVQKIEIREAIADVKRKQAVAREKRRRVSEAKDQADEQMTKAYDDAIESLDRAYADAQAKVDAARDAGASPG